MNYETPVGDVGIGLLGPILWGLVAALVLGGLYGFVELVSSLARAI